MLDALYQNPMAWISLVFAFTGAVGFYFFAIGFFAGVPHLFTISSHEGHLEHHRLRATFGVLIMVHAFLLWEVVRLAASWFGGPAVDPGIVGGLLLAYILVYVVLQIMFGITKAVTSGGGH